MLNKIKGAFTGFIAKVILVILTASFVIVGFYGYNAPDVNSVASVNGESISTREYSRIYQDLISRRGQNGQLTDDDLSAIQNQALQYAVNRKLMLASLKEAGIVAGDQSVARFIVTMPELRTDNRFNEKKLTALIQSQNISRQEFERSIRNDLTLQKFSALTQAGSSQNVTGLAEKILKISNTQYNGQALELTKDLVADPFSPPSDADLLDYYNSNLPAYTTEKGFDLKIVRYDALDLAETITVDEAEVRQMYEQQKSRLSTPANYKVSRIYFPKSDRGSEYRAKVVLRTLRRYPFNFEKYIQRYSKDPEYKDSDGVLPALTYGQIPEYDAVVNEIKNVGDFAREVIETENAFVLIKLLERNEKSEPQYETFKPFIEAQIKQARAQEGLKAFGAKTKAEILKQTESENDFEAIFSARNKVVFDQPNLTSTTKLNNIRNARTFYFSIVDKPVGHIGVYTFEDDAFIFYKIENIVPSRQLSFDEVQPQIVQSLEDRYYQDKINEIYNTFSQKVTDKTGFEEMVKELKAEKQVKDISFTSGGDGIESLGNVKNFKDALKTTLKEGIGRTVFVQEGERSFVGFVENVEPYEITEENKGDVGQFAEGLSRQIPSMYLSDLQQKMVSLENADANVTYNDRILRQFTN